MYERYARLGLSNSNNATSGKTGEPANNLITFTRAWMRPWAFESVENEQKRDQLKKIYPNGCYVAFAGDVYCESRDENMDDHWKMIHAMPGDGQVTPSLGQALLSLQERINELCNILDETFEHGIASTIMDSNLMPPGAVKDQVALPGAFYWLTKQPGQSFRDQILQLAPSQVGGELIGYLDKLIGELSQFISGALPSLWGGEMENNDTASGYAQAKEGAMGRLGLTWREIKYFIADVMVDAVNCFRANRYEDVEIPLEGKSGEWHSEWIRQADLKGNLCAYPESDEEYPVLWAEMRAVVLSLLQSQQPGIQEILAHPDNVELIQSLIGLTDFVIPEGDSRDKQHREIEQLLKEQPIMGPDGQPQPSLPVDPWADDHQVELETVKTWLNSEEGQGAKEENQMGWQNVKAHGMMHEVEIMQAAIKAQLAAAPAATLGPKGPPPGPAPAAQGAA